MTISHIAIARFISLPLHCHCEPTHQFQHAPLHAMPLNKTISHDSIARLLHNAPASTLQVEWHSCVCVCVTMHQLTQYTRLSTLALPITRHIAIAICPFGYPLHIHLTFTHWLYDAYCHLPIVYQLHIHLHCPLPFAHWHLPIVYTLATDWLFIYIW